MFDDAFNKKSVKKLSLIEFNNVFLIYDRRALPIYFWMCKQGMPMTLSTICRKAGKQTKYYVDIEVSKVFYNQILLRYEVV